MIDLSLANENQVYVQPLVNESPDDVLGMLKHPRTLATFSDSGAHVCQEMGSSLQTHFLSYWVRKRGAFTLEEAIKKLTHDNAQAWEMEGRGLVREGCHADLLLLEEDRVRPCLPTVEKDLPGGARRLVQKAEGIKATIVGGAVAFQDGEATDARAGQVIKGRLPK
jgi:N-acyl-D-aspartate/D-glutamate deacylase